MQQKLIYKMQFPNPTAILASSSQYQNSRQALPTASITGRDPLPGVSPVFYAEQPLDYRYSTNNNRSNSVNQAWIVPMGETPSELPPPYSATEANTPNASYTATACNYSYQERSNIHSTDAIPVQNPFKLNREYFVSNLAILKLMEFVRRNSDLYVVFCIYNTVCVLWW